MPEDSWRNLFYPPPDYQYFENAAQFPFEPQVKSFSWRDAWWLAEMAMLAYVKDWDRVVRPTLQRTGFDVSREIGLQPAMSTKGLMAARSNPEPFAVVAFRGPIATTPEPC